MNVVQIADALVTALAAQAWSAPYASITPVREYRPKYTLEQLETLRVSVVPGGIAGEQVARDLAEMDRAVAVCVQRRADTDAEKDALVALCDEIAVYCLNADLGASGQCQSVALAVDGPYDLGAMEEDAVFVCAMTATFKEVV